MIQSSKPKNEKISMTQKDMMMIKSKMMKSQKKQKNRNMKVKSQKESERSPRCTINKLRF